MVAIAPTTPDPSNSNMARRHKQVARLSSFITSDGVVAIPSPSLDLSVLRWSPKTEELPDAEPGDQPAERGGRRDVLRASGVRRPRQASPARAQEPDIDAPNPASNP